MPFIVRIIVIAVNNSYCVVQMQFIFEAKPAPRIEFQHPAFILYNYLKCDITDIVQFIPDNQADHKPE